MTTDRQQQALNLERADQAAQREFAIDALESPVASCPAREGEIFIVPTRYALVEDAVDDAYLQPGYSTRSHPIAVRRLRPGYLYVWQGEGRSEEHTSELQSRPHLV